MTHDVDFEDPTQYGYICMFDQIYVYVLSTILKLHKVTFAKMRMKCPKCFLNDVKKMWL